MLSEVRKPPEDQVSGTGTKPRAAHSLAEQERPKFEPDGTGFCWLRHPAWGGPTCGPAVGQPESWPGAGFSPPGRGSEVSRTIPARSRWHRPARPDAHAAGSFKASEQTSGDTPRVL